VVFGEDSPRSKEERRKREKLVKPRARPRELSPRVRDVAGQPRGHPDYVTDAEDCAGMPQGSRSRGRRNRHRRRFQQRSPKAAAESSRDGGEQRRRAEEEIFGEEEGGGNDSVARTNDSARAEKSANCECRVRPNDRHRIEKIELTEPRPRIIEITTVSSLPLEATIGHIAGVGILETGGGDRTARSTVMTVSEPVEPFGERAVKRNRLEIREVSDSEVEVDCGPSTIVEFESDPERERDAEDHAGLKRRAQIGQEVAPQRKLPKPETDSPISMWATVMPRDVERKLRNFIEDLQLPSFSEDVAAEAEGGSDERISRRETEEGRSLERAAASSRRKTRKRAALTSHYANSFLGIIQEEGEKLSEDEAQHIRDFINEEISKYRREDRRSAEESSGESKERDGEELETGRQSRGCDTEIKIDATKSDIPESRSWDESDEEKETDQDVNLIFGRNVTNEAPVISDTALESANEETETRNDVSFDEPETDIAKTARNKLEAEQRISEKMEKLKNVAPYVDEKRSTSDELRNIDAAVNYSVSMDDANHVHENAATSVSSEIEATEGEARNGDGSRKSVCGNREGSSRADKIVSFSPTLRDEATSSRMKQPPPLPRRSSSFGHEPQRPPTPPEIDYIASNAGVDQPLVAARDDARESRPTDLLARRIRAGREAEAEVADEPPQRPELPKDAGCSSARTRTTVESDLSRESSLVRDEESCVEQQLVRTNSAVLQDVEALAEHGRSITSSGIRDDDLSRERDVGTPGVALASATCTEITRREEGKLATLGAPPTHNRNASPSRQEEGEAEVCRRPADRYRSGKESSRMRKQGAAAPIEPVSRDKSNVSWDPLIKEQAMGSSGTKDEKRLREEEGNTVFRERIPKNEMSGTRTIEETTSAKQADRLGNPKYSTWDSRSEERYEEETRGTWRQSNARNPSNDEEASLQSLDVLTNGESVSEGETGDGQGHDSSSSTTSFNTIKHRPSGASLTDISAIVRETKEDKPREDENAFKEESESLNRKLTLLKREGETVGNDPGSPQPIPYSPVEDLYYAPLNEAERVKGLKEVHREDTTSGYPTSLRELCVRRILSMPFGPQLIGEITTPRLNIFESLRTLQRFVSNVSPADGGVRDDNARLSSMHGVSDQRHGLTKTPRCGESLVRPNVDVENDVSDRTGSRSGVNVELSESDSEMERQCWRGLSTKEDPRLLVCLSPSQQAAPVRTSADILLDLHRKFLNRYSYREEQPQYVPVPQYRVQICPMSSKRNDDATLKAPKPPTRAFHRDVDGASSRLLEIIKEERNGAIADRQSSDVDSAVRDETQERPKAARLSDRSSLARRDQRSAIANHELFSAVTRGENGGSRSDDKPAGHVVRPDRSDITIHRSIIGEMGHGSDTAAARDSERPFAKGSYALNSAIIDLSMDNADKKTPPAIRRMIDPGKHVNPALIDDKLQVPPLPKRAITVDRSCIDTTSIFCQNPPRSHLEPRRTHCEASSPEKLKRVAAVEIMDKLKKLQTETSRRLDGDRRASLPQEYFVQQLRYIELLEEQLKNVILAEEEERRAFEEFQTQYHRTKFDARKSSHADEESSSRRTGAVGERDNDEIPSHRVGDGTTNGKCAREKREESCFSEGKPRCQNGPGIQREYWREKSRDVEAQRTETIDKTGSRQFLKKSRYENGVREEEESSESVEREERRVMTRKESAMSTKLVNEEAKLRGRNDEVNGFQADARRARTIAREHLEGSTEKTTLPTFCENIEMKRPITTTTRTLPTNGEAFRQRMYDEYVHKVLERQERRNHKVVKISSHEDIKSRSDGGSDMSAMAREFIEKARSRLSKFGIDLDGSGTEHEEEHEGDVISARFLIDGKELGDARKLPKHLREFLKLSETMTEEGAGGELRRMEWTVDFAVLLVVLRDGLLPMAAERVFRPRDEWRSAKGGDDRVTRGQVPVL